MLGYWLVVVVAKRLMMDLSNIPSNTSYPYIHYLAIQQLRQGDRKPSEILGRGSQKR